MEYLNDDNLEKLGLIKEIDTLKIVEKSKEIKEKRKKRLLFMFFIIMIITAFIGQVFFVYMFGRVKFIRVGVLIYVFVSLVLALVLIDKGEKNLC